MDENKSNPWSINGHGINNFVPRRAAAYIGKNVHIEKMIVYETFAYASPFQGMH